MWIQNTVISTPPAQHYMNNGSALMSANLLATLVWSFCVTIVSKRCSLPQISSIHLVFQFKVLARRGLFWIWDTLTYTSTNRNLGVKIYIPLRTFFSKDFFSFFPFSGYHHVDIFPDHRKYLAFSWDFREGHTRHFQFIVLPFGLFSAPFIFTKLLKTIGNSLEVTGDPYSHIFSAFWPFPMRIWN